jgi:hypothetical protein
MQTHTRRPDLERLSMLTVTILLVYAMTQFIRQPAGNLAVQLPGFFLPISVNFRNLVWLGIVILAAAGMNWMLGDEQLTNRRSRLQHWLLPSLTAWVIGVPLYSLPSGTVWWIVYILGGIMLTLVFLSEFYCADPSDTRAPLAALALTGISFALFLILAVSIRFTGTRLYLLGPTIGIGSLFVSLRTLHLRSGGWQYAWSFAAAILVTQVSVGLFYLPVMPLQFGLVLTGFLYGAVTLGERLRGRAITPRDLVEPAAAVVVAVLLALVMP